MFIQILIEHFAENSVDPDQIHPYGASDLGLQCTPSSNRKDAKPIRVYRPLVKIA